MPALQGFLTRQRDAAVERPHGPDLAHRGRDRSTETGLYPDRDGLTVTNSYEFFDQARCVAAASATSARRSSTGPTRPTPRPANPLPTLITAGQRNTPAPWVAFTRAGCDFGGVGAADMELENTTSDVTQVFGANSPEAGLGNYVVRTSRPGSGRPQPRPPPTSRVRDPLLAAVQRAGRDVRQRRRRTRCRRARRLRRLQGPVRRAAREPVPHRPAGRRADAASPGAPVGLRRAPPVYDVFAPNATNSGPNAAPASTHPARSTPPPSTSAGGDTTTDRDHRGGTATPASPASTGWRPTTRSATRPRCRRPASPSPTRTSRTSTTTTTTLNHGNAFGPGEAGMEAQLPSTTRPSRRSSRRLANDGITKAQHASSWSPSTRATTTPAARR